MTTVRALLVSILLGLGYYMLIDAARGFIASQRLPEPLMDLWIARPLLGAWLIGALEAVVSYWLMAASVGLALALLVRREFVFYGAVATGAALIVGAQLDMDGWYALVSIGPDFWLAHQLNSIAHDPFGALSLLLALPVSTWVWGRLLL